MYNDIVERHPTAESAWRAYIEWVRSSVQQAGSMSPTEADQLLQVRMRILADGSV
jgi:hypothetical protein